MHALDGCARADSSRACGPFAHHRISLPLPVAFEPAITTMASEADAGAAPRPEETPTQDAPGSPASTPPVPDTEPAAGSPASPSTDGAGDGADTGADADGGDKAPEAEDVDKAADAEDVDIVADAKDDATEAAVAAEPVVAEEANGEEPVQQDPAAPDDADSADGADEAADDVADTPAEPAAEDGGIDPGDHEATVRVLQADASTPYHSVSTFEELGLAPRLLKGVYHAKFNKPSKIQASSLPMILGVSASGEAGPPRNLVGQAHNGSGKTACFVLGMLSRVDDSERSTQALCVVPTRELARQIVDVIRMLGKYTDTTVHLAVKQNEPDRRGGRRPTARNVPVTDHLVVGTPGKILDLIKTRSLNTTGVRIFVLDEADQMVDTQGMGDQTLRIKRTLPRSVQTLLFSATYRDEVRSLALKIAPEANQIFVDREDLSLTRVAQFYLVCDSAAARFDVLSEIYELLTLSQSVIFVNSRRGAGALATQLRDAGHTVSLLYGGDMTPQERDRVLDEFRTGTTRVLVTTNVLSRGVDVAGVTVVINYDMPLEGTTRRADPETYIHRVGRTGRFGRKGIAINLVHDAASRKVLQDIETAYQHKMTEVADAEELEEKIKAM